MNTKMRIIWSTVCLTCCVNAEHVSSFDSLYNADSGYVVMTGSDKEYRSSYITAGKWSDGSVPHSGTNYYVGSVTGGDRPFGGHRPKVSLGWNFRKNTLREL